MDFDVMTTLSNRLRMIRETLGESQKGMARRFGLGDVTWQTLELKGRSPKGEILTQLIEMGYSADWLLTGIGTMQRDTSRLASGAIDEQLLADVLELIDEWLSVNRRTMPLSRKAEVTASIYAMAVEDVADGKASVDQRRVAQILKLVV